VEFSVRCPYPPNTYSHVREENLGSTRKVVEIYLLFTCITNLILALHMQSVNGLEKPFYLRQWKKVPPAHAQVGVSCLRVEYIGNSFLTYG
jgi:hypothetical protein